MIYHDPHLTGSILLGNNAGVSGSLDVAGPGGGGFDAVFGNIGVQSVADTNSLIGFNSYYDGASPRARRDGHSAWIQVVNGKFYFRNSPYTGSNQITENNTQLFIDTSGSVGIGTTSPSEKLEVEGNARIRSIGSGTSAGALHYESDGTLTTNTSDRRLKRDINYISGSHYLDKVLALSPVTFKWKLNDKVTRDDQEIILREQEVSGSLV